MSRDYLRLLDESVRNTLSSGRIGTPVFVRWTAAVADSSDELKTHLTAMALNINCWLDTQVHRLYVTGTETQGHLSLAIDYANGTSALLALTLAHQRPHVHLAIYGNQGAIYHSEFLVSSRDGQLTPPPIETLPNETGQQPGPAMLVALEKALATQQPVVLLATGGGV